MSGHVQPINDNNVVDVRIYVYIYVSSRIFPSTEEWTYIRFIIPFAITKNILHIRSDLVRFCSIHLLLERADILGIVYFTTALQSRERDGSSSVHFKTGTNNFLIPRFNLRQFIKFLLLFIITFLVVENILCTYINRI